MVQDYIKGLLFLLCLFTILLLNAQTHARSERKSTIFDKLISSPDLSAELETQIDSLLIMRLKPYEAMGSILFSGDSLDIRLPVKVSVRGKYRRRTCDFPPLLLNFPKGHLRDLGLKNSDEYKLVTQCLDDKGAENYLFREFLVYQMYRELDKTGFRSVLFPIRYVDSNSQKVRRSFAIMLESNDEVKDRLDGKWCQCMGIHADSINVYYRELVTFFQYMIGNKDINMHIEHNVRFLEGDGYEKKIPIPYDFDFSAFVRAPYVFSDQSVTFDRTPLVVGKSSDEFAKVLSLFLAKKDRFYQIIDDFKLLSKRHEKRCIKFMDDFFRLVERPNFSSRYLR